MKKQSQNISDSSQFQVGDQNIQINIQQQLGEYKKGASSKDELNLLMAKELGITQGAIQAFLVILEKKPIPLEMLVPELIELAQHYKALKTSLAELSCDDPKVNALRQEAEQALEVLDLDKARERLREASRIDIKAIEAQEQNIKTRRLSAAMSESKAAEVALLELHYHEAADSYQQAIKLVKPTNAETVLASYLVDLGNVYETLAQYDDAIECTEKALAIYIKQDNEDYTNIAKCRNRLGLAWESKGEYDKAIEFYELALASDLKTFSPDHPNVANRRNNLGFVWQKKGEYDKAIEHYKSALRICELRLGEGHPNTNTVRNNLEAAQANLLAPIEGD